MSVHGAKMSRNGRRATRRAAFYDLDGTLVDSNLVHAALYMLANLGQWGARIGYLAGFVARAPKLYLAERQDRRVLNVVLFEALKGVSRDRLFAIGDEYCERVLMDHVYTQAMELIESNRAAGLVPVLVTGSPEFIVAPFARRLKIPDFVANRLVTSRGRATGRLHEPVMAGSEKAAWCAAWARARGIELGECWGYADSFYDLPFLAALGHPVAVNPDRRLYATTMSRNWPVMRFAKTRRQERAAGRFWLLDRLLGTEHSDGAR
jgi:HAD superfamily hydrolase (TIGR01490 family)